MSHVRALLAGLLGLLLAATGCGRSRPPTAAGPLRVAATTSILGDVVDAVGGSNITLTVLLKPGQDPHAFNPAPADLAALSQSTLLFINGFGLETFLPRLPSGPLVVDVSRAIAPRRLSGPHHHDDHDAHADGGADPHVWFDPTLVAGWTDAIRDALSRRDPAHAAGYAVRAAAYRAQLEKLDDWIRVRVNTIPPERRRLVTDHAVLGYFAARYGFTLDGALVPAFSSAAEPSARDLAALVDLVRAHKISALFVSQTSSPTLAERIAADTGARVVRFHAGALSGPGGPAATYLDFMRHNTLVIVQGLKD